MLQDKRYTYSTIFLPHDVKKRSQIDLSTSYEREFRRLFQHTEIRIIVLPKMDKQLQIANGRSKFKRCVFNMKKVKSLIDHLMKYRKTWRESLNSYVEEPFDDKNADYADAFCYMARGVSHLEASGLKKDAILLHEKAKSNKFTLL
jgi:hypothetical protein